MRDQGFGKASGPSLVLHRYDDLQLKISLDDFKCKSQLLN